MLWMAAWGATDPSNPEQALYGLIDERLSLMRTVAAHKWHHGLPIEDLEREAVVVKAGQADGLRYGIRPDTSRRLFTVQIEAAKDIQRFWFDRWQSARAPENVPDLNRVVRPQLIELGEAIVASLGSVDSSGDEPLFQVTVVIDGLTDSRRAELFEALVAIEHFENRLEQITSTGELRVGTTGDYAPFSFSDDGVHFEGIDIDLARDLAETLGVRTVFVQTSWPTLLADLQSGSWDIAMSGVSRTEARASVGHLSSEYYIGGKTPIALCKRRDEFTTLHDIDRPDVRIIVNPGGTNESFVDDRIRYAEKLVHNDNRTIFDALISGAADVMITDRIEVALQTRRHAALCATMSETLTYQEKGFLMPQDEVLKHHVDEWLMLRRQEGMVEALIDRHLNR